MKSPAIFLMGPTASGKTDAAVFLSHHFPLEIISVDSAMIYRGMDIGTAKPGRVIQQRTPHRLVDILEPHESYSAARFREDAMREMADIKERGKVPLLVGGTMLYFRALEHGLADMPGADPTVRAKLSSRMKDKGLSALHAELADIDPAAASRIDVNDAQRIQRALEVYYLTGKTLTAHHAQSADADFPFHLLKLVLAPTEREVLHARIEARFNIMLENGFLDEVRRLKNIVGVHAALPAMRAVGYRQAWGHLEGNYGVEEMRRRGVVATRRYAKRQLTWMRGEPGVTWVDAGKPDYQQRISRLVGNFLTENS
ncbi:MAG: tRNA (adenosine(37)-N6)-dimethylallyltransferase MiaA [Gammaproteobacteria bacterium]